MDKLYRVDGSTWGNEEEGTLSHDLIINEYKVVKETCCGVWIKPHSINSYSTSSYGSKLKFVNLERRKRFACPTIKEALVSFIIRKERQIHILKYQLKGARVLQRMAEMKLERIEESNNG